MAEIVSKNILMTHLLHRQLPVQQQWASLEAGTQAVCALHIIICAGLVLFCFLLILPLKLFIYWHEFPKSPVNIDFSRRAEKSDRSLIPANVHKRY